MAMTSRYTVLYCAEKMADEDGAQLKLNIKTTRQKLSVEIAADATIRKVGGGALLCTLFDRARGRVATLSPALSLQLKELLCARMPEAPVEHQCLIFAGKILKDEESLESQGELSG